MLLLHTILEILSAERSARIGKLFHDRAKTVPDMFNVLLTAAFFASASTICLHGALSFFYPSMIMHWVPWSWGMTDIQTSSLVVFASLFSTSRLASGSTKIVCMLSVLFGLVLYAVPIFADVSWVYQNGLIHRPLDIVVLALEALAATLLFSRGSARRYMPLRGLKTYFLLSILQAAVMAFLSTESLDQAFMVAHLIRLVKFAHLERMLAIDGYAAEYGHTTYLDMIDTDIRLADARSKALLLQLQESCSNVE